MVANRASFAMVANGISFAVATNSVSFAAVTQRLNQSCPVSGHGLSKDLIFDVPKLAPIKRVQVFLHRIVGRN